MSRACHARFGEERDLQWVAKRDPWPKPDTWRRKLEANELVVAAANDELVGLLRWERIWTTVPFISFITVDAPQRGKGYSVLMVEFLKGWLKARGAPALLSSAQADDPSAQSWHEHLGFKRNGLIENIADAGVGEVVYRILL